MQAEPFGVALILGPWNYPVQLLVSAIAAGDLAGRSISLSTPKTLAFRTEAGDALSFGRLTLLVLPILFNH
jgi:aldehyde dehydrogenase (NAD+)